MERLIRQDAARGTGSYTENADPRGSTAGHCQDAPGCRLPRSWVGRLFVWTVKTEMVVNITVHLPG